MRVIISYNNRHLKYIKVFIKKSNIKTGHFVLLNTVTGKISKNYINTHNI